MDNGYEYFKLEYGDSEGMFKISFNKQMNCLTREVALETFKEFIDNIFPDQFELRVKENI